MSYKKVEIALWVVFVVTIISLVTLLVFSLQKEATMCQDTLGKVLFVRGMNLAVTMKLEGETLTVRGEYAARAPECAEILSKVRYQRLQREYGMVSPSALGPIMDWFMDQLGRLMFPLKPGNSWGPYEYEVGEGFKF